MRQSPKRRSGACIAGKVRLLAIVLSPSSTLTSGLLWPARDSVIPVTPFESALTCVQMRIVTRF